jgi:hypothetical protein
MTHFTPALLNNLRDQTEAAQSACERTKAAFADVLVMLDERRPWDDDLVDAFGAAVEAWAATARGRHAACKDLDDQLQFCDCLEAT